MAVKLYLHPNDDTQNLPFCGLKLVVVETFGQTIKRTNQSKFNKPTNKKTLL